MYIYCGNLPGCNSGWTERISPVLTLLLGTLPTYVIGLATLFIMIGGVYMIINAGDSEKVTRGKNTILWAIIGIFVTEFAADFVAFDGTNLMGGGFIPKEVGSRVSGSDLVTSIINTLIQSIFILSYIVILGFAIFNGMRMVLTFGKEDEFNKAKEGLFWAAVGAIILNLAAAIVNAFATL